MTIEAPLSKSKRNDFLIGIVACMVFALWFAYDGYLNKKFIAEHMTEQGQPDDTLVINRYAPPFLVLGALLLGACWYAIRSRKLVAAEDALVFPGGRKIPYAAIEAIDKTHFETKGFFTLTYKSENGSLAKRRLSDRQFENLKPLLEHLIAQIT
jgi:hypothetical protein